MRPNLLPVPHTAEASFDVRHEQLPYFTNPWHFHPELELNYVVRSSGTRFIGQSVERFEGEEIILLGSNLPHYWKNDATYYDPTNELTAEAIVVRFAPDFAGKSFFDLPETRRINGLFERAAVGLKLQPPLSGRVGKKLKQLTTVSGFPQLMLLFELLHQIAESEAVSEVSVPYLPSQQWQKQNERMSRVMAFLLGQFTVPILLDQVAEVASMNPAAFCRYFRSHTGQTLTQFVTDLRIRYACELLIKTDDPITAIGEQAGFENASHFVQTFRKQQGQTPAVYRRKMAG